MKHKIVCKRSCAGELSSAGFSIVEILIVVAIIGIVSVGLFNSYNNSRTVNSVNSDLNEIAVLLKKLRIEAFTQKVNFSVTVAPTQITTVRDPAGVATAGPRLDLKNSVLVTGSPFTISTRGNFTTGNIRINPRPANTKYSCVVIDNVRIRLGEINAAGTGCNAM